MESKLRINVELMTAYSRPGCQFFGKLTDLYIVDQINQVFGLKDSSWVTAKTRKIEYRVPRQLLMACLIEHIGLPLRVAGEYCMRDHATAHHSHKIVTETLWNDKTYGDKIKMVYMACNALKK